MFEGFVIGCKVASLFFALFTSIALLSQYLQAYCKTLRESAWVISSANQVAPAFFWTAFIALTYYV